MGKRIKWLPMKFRGEILFGYEVSNDGRVRSVVTGRELGYVQAGRPTVTLRILGEQYVVAIRDVVAQTFLGAGPNVRVGHLDGDRRNVAASNLRVVGSRQRASAR